MPLQDHLKYSSLAYVPDAQAAHVFVTQLFAKPVNSSAASWFLNGPDGSDSWGMLSGRYTTE